MDPRDIILVTSGYKVIALRKSDGSVLWTTELIRRFFKPSTPFVTLLVDETGVYAHAINEMFRLDLATGAIQWQTELPTASWFGNSNVASLAALGRGASPSAQAAVLQMEARNSDGGGA